MQMGNSYDRPVTVSRVTISGAEYIGIVAAGKDTPAESVIDAEDVGTLWLTLQAASKATGLPVANVFLKGEEVTEDGKWWEIIPGAVTAKAKASGNEYTLAYSPKQINGFEPKSLYLAWGRFSKPQLHAGLMAQRSPKAGTVKVREDKTIAAVRFEKPQAIKAVRAGK